MTKANKKIAKPAEVKKLNNGKLAVRWEGKQKFEVIEDDVVAQFLIYMVIQGPGHEIQAYSI